MLYMRDLIEMFTEVTEGDKREALESVGELLEDIQRVGVEAYIEGLKDEAIELDLCPECFGNLQVTTIGEDITEAWGRVETTPVNVLICEECGELVNGN